MSILKPPAKDPSDIPVKKGSAYPDPFADAVGERTKRRLGDVLGLTNFGVNLVTLPPGAWSSQRHWHTRQDEFIHIVSGTATLITDSGEQELCKGAIAGFPANSGDGHHLVNNSAEDVVYLEVGDRTAGDSAHYPDIDLKADPADGAIPYVFVHKDGTPYE